MTQPEAPSISEPTQADVAKEKADTEARVKRFFEYADKEHKKDRDHFDDIKNFTVDGKHWAGQEETDHTLPSTPIDWLHCDTLEASIAQRPGEPKIVAETATDLSNTDPAVIAKWTQRRDSLGQVFGKRYAQRKDNEVGADLIGAAVDAVLEQINFKATRKMARHLAVRYGASYFYTGYDDTQLYFQDTAHYCLALHPKKVIYDPKATIWTGNDYNGRFLFVGMEMTRRQINAKWKSAEGYNAPKREDTGAQDMTDTADEMDRMHEVYTVFLCESETRDATPEEEMELEGFEPGQVDKAGLPIEFKAPEKPTQIPKAVGGWMQGYYWAGKLLDIGPISTPDKKLPVHRYVCYPTDSSVTGQGIPDKIKSTVMQHDKFLRDIHDNAASTGNNQIIYDRDAVESPTKAFADTPGNVVESLKPDGIKFHQGLDVSGSLFRITEMQIRYAEMITGQRDLAQKDDLPGTTSGAHAKRLEGASQARVSEIAVNEREAVRSAVKSIAAQVMAFDDEPKNYKIKAMGKTHYENFAPATDLGGDGFDEIRFDVVVDDNRQLPTDPTERNKLVMGLLGELRQMGPILGFACLDMLDLPNREEIRNALEQEFESKTDQPSEAVQSLRAQAAKDTSQALQKLATGLQPQYPRLALDLALAITPITLAIMQGEDYSQLIPDLSALPMVAAPETE